jgi:hypothetical protein
MINVNSPGKPTSARMDFKKRQTGTMATSLDAPTPSSCQSPRYRTYHLRWVHEIRPDKFPGDSAKFCKASGPTPQPSLLLLYTRCSLHQYNPCRGSSIGRACGSYNSKEINLKVVGSSPTFGYSYIQAHQSSCSFAFCSFGRPSKYLTLPLACREPRDTLANVLCNAYGEVIACQLHALFARQGRIPWRRVPSIRS